MRPPKAEEPKLKESPAKFEVAPEPLPEVTADEVLDGMVMWMEMDHAPQDGTLIEYRAKDDSIHYARWRITRRRNFETKRWDVVGFWADPQTREPVAVEPYVWRLPDGYLLPGMVV